MGEKDAVLADWKCHLTFCYGWNLKNRIKLTIVLKVKNNFLSREEWVSGYKAICYMGRSIILVAALNRSKQYLCKPIDLIHQCHKKKAVVINQMWNYTIFYCVVT